MADNYIRNIAIIGASGSVGKYITDALVAQKKHTVTVLTRAESASSVPEGVDAVHRVDYNDHDALTKSLTGQDALIITLSVRAPKDMQSRLVDAAVAAGVRWIMPNEYGFGASLKAQIGDNSIGAQYLATRQYIETASAERAGNSVHWISLACGFWYEFSLAGSENRYGFDFDAKSLTLFDDGNARLSTSTWPLCGEAVAKIFALPLTTTETKDELSLTKLANSAVPIASFTLTQRDMLASVLRVTGDKESDWTVKAVDSKERYEQAQEDMKAGSIPAYVTAMYTRMFYPECPGDHSRETLNEQLDLAREELDERTKIAVQYHAEDLLGQRYGQTTTSSKAK